MPRLNKFLIGLIILIGLNIIGLDAWTIYKLRTTSELRPSPPTLGGDRGVVSIDQCGPDCQKYIADAVAGIKFPSPQPTSKTVVTSSASKKVTTVSYVPVPGSGQTMSNDWANLPSTEFYFNLADYPGLQSIYFETNIRLLNGNGVSYVRLFDVTHGIGVQGSGASTSNQVSSPVESGQVSFWQGKNLIRVQAKSLTADTAIFDSGRLKITTLN